MNYFNLFENYISNTKLFNYTKKKLYETNISDIDHSAGRSFDSQTLDPDSMQYVIAPRLLNDIDFKKERKRKRKPCKQKLHYYKRFLNI